MKFQKSVGVFQFESPLVMATPAAERRKRVIEDARDAGAFVKLGYDLVGALSLVQPLVIVALRAKLSLFAEAFPRAGHPRGARVDVIGRLLARVGRPGAARERRLRR